MIQGVVYTKHDQQLILPHVMKTSSAIERMQGLLFRAPLKKDEGLLIKPCSSIHTVGMQYNIDVVFLDKNLTIKKMYQHVKPWRCAMSFGASMVLELMAGTINKLKLQENMNLQWETTQ